jgi:hypothetical protein
MSKRDLVALLWRQHWHTKAFHASTNATACMRALRKSAIIILRRAPEFVLTTSCQPPNEHYIYIHVCVCVCVCVCACVCVRMNMYVCMYVHTYYVLIKRPMPYIASSPLCLLRVFSSCLNFASWERTCYITSSQLCLLRVFTSYLNFGSWERPPKGGPL